MPGTWGALDTLSGLLLVLFLLIRLQLAGSPSPPASLPNWNAFLLPIALYLFLFSLKGGCVCS